MKTNKLTGLVMGIGSLPYTDISRAIELCTQNQIQIPYWPQLPKLSFKESMYVQYSENLPGLIVDEHNRKVWFDVTDETKLNTEIERFYDRYLANDLDYFQISEPYAAGLYSFGKQILSLSEPSLYLKGQITGPISFGLTTTDQGGRSIFYNDLIVDILIKSLTMKIRWQIDFLRRLTIPTAGRLGSELIIFIDEPYLASFGSAYVSLSREQVILYLNELIDVIHQENTVAGIHCCGNTDWSIIMDTKVDVISFDAYNYGESITLYPDKLVTFFDRGGVLAYGIIPSEEKVNTENIDSLHTRLNELFRLMERKGISQNQLIKSCLFSPSCGVGSLPLDIAERVLTLTRELGLKFQRDRIGLNYGK